MMLTCEVNLSVRLPSQTVYVDDYIPRQGVQVEWVYVKANIAWKLKQKRIICALSSRKVLDVTSVYSYCFSDLHKQPYCRFIVYLTFLSFELNLEFDWIKQVVKAAHSLSQTANKSVHCLLVKCIRCSRSCVYHIESENKSKVVSASIQCYLRFDLSVVAIAVSL